MCICNTWCHRKMCWREGGKEGGKEGSEAVGSAPCTCPRGTSGINQTSFNTNIVLSFKYVPRTGYRGRLSAGRVERKWNKMEWITQGLPPPCHGALGPGLPEGEGQVTAASSGPVIAGLWVDSPPLHSPRTSQDYFCPSAQQTGALGFSDLGGAPLPKVDRS